LTLTSRREKYSKGVFPIFVNTLTYKIIKISIITILKISDNDRHQLTTMTNPLSVLSNHPGRSMWSVQHRIWTSIIFSHKLETHSKTVVALDDHEMKVGYIYIYIIVLSIRISFNLLIYSNFYFRHSVKQLHILQGTISRSNIIYYYVCVLCFFSHVCLVGSTYIYYYEYFSYLFTFIYLFIYFSFQLLKRCVSKRKLEKERIWESSYLTKGTSYIFLFFIFKFSHVQSIKLT